MNVTGWVMSEKYDGVRAYWDGDHLISRGGKVFSPPKSFTQGFPPFALDGELWSERGSLEEIVSIVNTKNDSVHKTKKRWGSLNYMVFELPHQEGDLFQRMKVLDGYLKVHTHTSIRPVQQYVIGAKEEVEDFYKSLIEDGAEGIVIRNPHLDYYIGRTNKSLKHKPYMDAECKLVSVIKGKGKFKESMGSILCDFNGKLIKIGSGFTDKERQMRFKTGSLVRFKYYGLTALGNPRYPVYINIRNKME